jgi:hypothetical protein
MGLSGGSPIAKNTLKPEKPEGVQHDAGQFEAHIGDTSPKFQRGYRGGLVTDAKSTIDCHDRATGQSHNIH